MACYSPLAAHRWSEGGKVLFGYPTLHQVKRSGEPEMLRIPCGSCFGCRMGYAEMWAIRLEHETAMSDRASFVTLTYDPDNVPWYGLDLGDLQRFLKRLRKKGSFRYFAAGEYGGDTGRPHFHLGLFNVNLEDRNGHSDLLARLWPYGFHSCSDFTPGRARYIAGYAVKKIRGRADEREDVCNFETGEIVRRRREFCVMSRNPGIGASFYERYRSDFLRGFIADRGGVKRRLPRYYVEKLRQDPLFVEREESRIADYLKELPPGADSPEQLAAREANHRARVGIYGSTRKN